MEYGRWHLMSRMNPFIVVISDLAVSGFNELTDVVEPSHVAKLEFEIAVKRFLVAVLPQTSFTAMRWLCAVACEQRLERYGDIFATLIRMEIFRHVSGSSRRILKCVDDEAGCVMICNVPTNNLSCMNVNHGCKIPEAIDEQEIGEISGLHHIRLNGADDFQNVFRSCFWPSKVVALYEAKSSANLRLETVFTHESPGLLAIHAKCPANSSGSIGRMFGHNRNDLVLVLLVEWWLLRFVVQVLPRDAELLCELGFRCFEHRHTLMNLSYFFPHASFEARTCR